MEQQKRKPLPNGLTISQQKRSGGSGVGVNPESRAARRRREREERRKKEGLGPHHNGARNYVCKACQYKLTSAQRPAKCPNCLVTTHEDMTAMQIRRMRGGE